MSIEVKNHLKIYGNQKAINNISFKINNGEVVGFLGPNGAGKSTTLKIITGFLQQTAGEALVCGLNVSDHLLEIKRRIGYLPESNALYTDMYVQEYLLFIAALHQLKNKNQSVKQVIERVGLDNEFKKKIDQLSKGYKQRVGLAAALIHNPEVLILDEPTSGLDPNQIIEIRELIKQEGKSKTVLFSSHILQEVEAVCDRVLVINKGEIVADDKLSALQNSNKKDRVVVEFMDRVEINLLQKIENVINVERMQTSNNNHSCFGISTVNPEAVRKHILELSLQHNFNIVSLQNETISLEEIFKSLTNNKTKHLT